MKNKFLVFIFAIIFLVGTMGVVSAETKLQVWKNMTSGTNVSWVDNDGNWYALGNLNITGGIYFNNSKCSSGQVLTTDSITGLVSCTPVTGLPGIVNGSGTLGYIPMWNSSGSLNNSVIYQNGGMIGIGIVNPIQKLTVVGNQANEPSLGTNPATAFSLLSSNALYGMYVGVNPTTGNSWIQAMRNDAATAYNLNLQPNGGNVGIGTTAPTRLLQLESGTNTVMKFRETSGTATNWTLGVLTNGNFVINDESNDTQRLVIDGSGNVGIGTTVPNATLHLNITTENNLTGLLINKVSDLGETALIVNHASSSSLRGIADFQNSLGSVMKILADGNVGINTTTPQQTLNVKGQANVTGAITTDTRFSWNGESTGMYKNTNNQIDFYTNGAARMILDSNGKIGINTSTPQTMFEVVNTTTSGTFGGYPAIVVNNPSNNGYAMFGLMNGSGVGGLIGRMYMDTTERMTVGTYANVDLILDTNATERMRITNTGFVGIGTASPRSKQEINYVTGSTLTGVDWIGLTINRSDSSSPAYGSGIALLAYQNKGTLLSSRSDSFSMFSYDNSTYAPIDLFKINITTRNTGINTSTPTNALTVVGEGNFTGNLYSNGALITSGNASWNESWANTKYVDVTGDTMTGGLALTNANITFNSDSTGIDFYGNNMLWKKNGQGMVLTVDSTRSIEDYLKFENGTGGTQYKVWHEANLHLSDLGGISGSGTSGYISSWNGTNSINNSVIYQNGTNIGIGVTNPANILQLFGVSGSTLVIQADSANNGDKAGIGLGASGVVLTGTNMGARIDFNRTGANSAGDLYFSTQSGSGLGERLRITSGGNVGIGTTNPSTTLHVVGTEYLSSHLYIGAGLSERIYSGTPSANYSYIELYNLSTGDMTFHSKFATGDINFETADSLTPKMKIEYTGKVGIGTITPQNILNVVGATGNISNFSSATAGLPSLVIGADSGTWDTWGVPIRATGGSSASSLRLQSDSGSIQLYDASRTYALNIYEGSNLDIKFSANASVPSYINSGANFGIGTVSPNNTLHVVGTGNITSNFSVDNTDLFVDANRGYVGIGTSTPASKLTILGNGNTSSTYYKRTGTNGFGIYNEQVGSVETLKISHTSNDFTSAINIINFNELGRVGINTTNPQNTLNVIGDANITGNLYSNGVLVGNGNISGFGTANNLSKFSAAGTITNSIMYDSGTNIGIGTSSPGAKLDVVSTYTDTVATNDFVYFARTGGAVKGVIGYDASVATGDAIYFGTNTSHPVQFRVGNSEKVRITTSGNVGIGTTSPQNTLNVVGDMNVTSSSYFRGNMFLGASSNQYIRYMTASNWYYFLNATGDDFYLHDLENANFFVAKYNGGGTGKYANIMNGAIYAYNDGKVGIGRTSPGYKLDVNGPVNASAYFVNGTAMSASSIGGINGSGTSGYIARWNGTGSINNSIIYQSSSNNVGIGTTNPGAKLEVNGSTRLWHGGTSYYTEFANTNEINTFNSTGGATTMYLQYRSGETNIGAANLRIQKLTSGIGTYLDASGRVGIGTSSPTVKLDVSGPVNASAYFVNGTQIGTGTITGGGTSGYLSSWNGTTSLNNSLMYQKGISVGIGTQNISVTNGIVTSGASVLGVVAPPGKDAFLRIIGGQGSTVGGLIIGNDDYGDLNVNNASVRGTIDYGAFIFNNSANTFSVFQNYASGYLGLGAGSRKSDLVIQATNGYVGINSTTPQNTLDVKGIINATGKVRAGTSYLTTLTGTGSGAYLRFGNETTDNALGTIGTYASAFNIDSYNGQMIFSFSGVSKTNISTVGNVTTATDVCIVGGNCLSNRGTGTITGSGTINNISKFTASGAIGDSLIYDTGSAIGIKTSSPQYTLDVKGTARIATWLAIDASDSQKTFSMHYNAASWPNYSAYFYQTGAADVYGTRGLIINEMNGQEVSNYGISLATNGTSRIFISNGGNVGINQVNPSHKLTVAGGNLAVESGNMYLASGYPLHFDYGISNSYYVQKSGTNLYFYTGGGYAFMNGSMGLGTTAPGYKLDVMGVVNASAYLVNGTAIGTGSITGGGTSGNLSHWNGTTSLENSLIYDNGTNIGIGTTSPSAKLVVIENATGQKVISRFSNLDITTGDISYIDVNQFVSGGSYHGYFGIDTSGTIRINSDSTTANHFALTNTGKVGIGTVSPNNTLHVIGTANVTSNLSAPLITSFRGGAGGTYWNNGLKIVRDDTPTQYGLINYDGGALRLGSIVEGGGNSGEIYFDRHNAGSGTVSTSMVINGSGAVGIGTVSPRAPLTVVSNLADGTIGNLLVLNSSNQGLNSGGAIEFVGDFTNARIATNNTASGDTDLLFQTSTNNVGALVTQMAITDDGYVGINTTTPTQTLNVVGTTNFTGASYLLNSKCAAGQVLTTDATTGLISCTTPSGGISGAGTATYIPLWNGTNSINNSVIYQNGNNIGINTTSPGGILDIQSATPTVLIGPPTGAVSQESSLEIYRTTGGAARVVAGDIYTTPGNVGYIGLNIDASNQSSYSLILKSHSSGYVLLNPTAGNVGVGTNIPQNTFNVVGDINATGYVLSSGVNLSALNATGLIKDWNATGYIKDWNATGFIRNWSLVAGNISGFGTANNLSKFSAAGTITNSLIYDNGTNVGIGIATPQYGKLEIASTASNTGGLALYRGTGSTARHWINSNDIYLIQRAATDTYGLAINPTGSVGIGTVSPNTTLHVVGTTNFTGASYLLNSKCAVGQALTTDATTGLVSCTTVTSISGVVNGSGTSGYIARFNGTGSINNSVIYQGASNNIGINTTSPNNNLEIRGASGLRISDPANIYRGNLVFGNLSNGWNSGIRTYDSGDAEMRIWHANAAGQIVLATGYNGETNTTMPTDGLFIDQNKVGIGYPSPAASTGKLTVNGNVGIGTVSPNTTLHVVGTTNFTGASYLLNSKCATGQVLTTDATTGLISCTTPAGGISGAGTALYIPMWNGTGSINNSVIYQNGGNISIGHSTPRQKLHVYAASGNAYGRFGYDTTYYMDLGYSVTSEYGYLQAMANGVVDDILINPSGGNVGINTTTPGTTFDVHGTANVTGATYLYNSKCAAGQVLTTDATTGLISCITAAGLSNVVNGTGTLLSIPMWNGTNSINNSIITQSGTKINVNGNLNTSAAITVKSSTTGIDSDGSSLYLNAGGNTYLNTASNTYVTNAGAMRVNTCITFPSGGQICGS